MSSTREVVVVQVGQCGNQIGRRFWQAALEEHASIAKRDGTRPIFDSAMSSFFRNVDTRTNPPLNIPVGDGTGLIRSLKARAVLVDSETRVLNATANSDIGSLFDSCHFVKDNSGSGNNWAVGHMEYGPKHHETIVEQLRRTAEQCDALQSFFLLHSLGGGTGSGLGTYILGMLHDYFPDVHRFTCSVLPSADDDVVTSPYNSVLALNELIEHADAVLPLDNQALADIVNRAEQQRLGIKPGSTSTPTIDPSDKKSAFDSMNEAAAQVIVHLTASMRFAGSLNVDLGEISTNLVPYPKMKFLLSSVVPLPQIYRAPPTSSASAIAGGGGGIGGRSYQLAKVDSMFFDAFSPHSQLLRTDPRQGMILGCGLLLRGNVQMSQVTDNVAKLKKSLRLVPWNRDGFKIGLCTQSPVNQPFSLLALSNNCCVSETLSDIYSRYAMLARKRTFLHHYTEIISNDKMDEAADNLLELIASYKDLSECTETKPLPRPIPMV